jgi:hypothetical protein
VLETRLLEVKEAGNGGMQLRAPALGRPAASTCGGDSARRGGGGRHRACGERDLGDDLGEVRSPR